MSRMTRDNWLVYAIFREIDGKAKAETYRHKVNAKNAELGINGDGEKSPWTLVKYDEDGGYIEKRFLPYHLTAEEQEDWYDSIEIRINSPWDCTGQRFTAWISFHEIPGGTWVYHCTGIDC